jgi:hypothetical protein
MRITTTPLTPRPLLGLGVEADPCLYHAANRDWGVTDADLALNERRLEALRPAIARLFVYLDTINPALDGRTFLTDAPEYQQLLAQLRRLEALGTGVNLVLFQPIPSTHAALPLLVPAFLSFLRHLLEGEGLTNLRWITLFNEPDGIFPHESPLTARLFAPRLAASPLRWPDYVALNRQMLDALAETGLAAQLRLAVADTVWGHPMRMERMQLATEAFRDRDVDYSYHNYSAEDPAFYSDNPDFAYPGMAAEARLLRDLVGPDAPLVLWEFNDCGEGMGSHYPGVGPHGEEVMGSLQSAVTVSAKILDALAYGADGACVWCLQDQFYHHHAKAGVMRFGLWRYKWEGWRLRPAFHYVAQLCQALTPGATRLTVEDVPDGIRALALQCGEARTLVVLNTTATEQRIGLTGLIPVSCTRVRLAELSATIEGPQARQEAVTAAEALPLAAGELCVVQAQPGAPSA